MHLTVEDLGVVGMGESNLDAHNGIVARHPRTGAEHALLPVMEHGFVALQPHTGVSVHVRPALDPYERSSRFMVQGPDGGVYLIGFRTGICQGKPRTWSLLRWDWDPERPPQPVLDGADSIYTCERFEFDALGRFYVASAGRLVRMDLRTRQATPLDWPGHVLLSSARDRRLYLQSGNGIVCLDPETDRVRPVRLPDGVVPAGTLLRQDGGGRIILQAVVEQRDGETYWLELLEGEARPIAASRVQLARTLITNNEVGQAEPWMTDWTAFAFSDDSYLSRIVRREVTWVDPLGRPKTFSFEHKPSPLQLYAIEAGGDRLWLGTVLPLHLLSYQPATGHCVNYGTPTPATGEIYNMVWSGGRLFFASYTNAYVTRLDPARPLRYDDSAQANPRQFGRIKTEGRPLHRIHGRARDPEGHVYFAAKGDYGCEDSGLCRIDIHTEEMRRWIFPLTTFGALTYLPSLGQLLVAERRKDEPDLRFLFVDATTGREMVSEPVIRDHGEITAWLHDGGDWVYGLHDYRATLFAYSLKERRIVKEIRELAFGDHCKESLLFGPDGRIWGVTRECVFAVDRALERKERLADYEDRMLIPHSRFGFCAGPDGRLYFLNGPRLMRITSPIRVTTSA